MGYFLVGSGEQGRREGFICMYPRYWSSRWGAVLGSALHLDPCWGSCRMGGGSRSISLPCSLRTGVSCWALLPGGVCGIRHLLLYFSCAQKHLLSLIWGFLLSCVSRPVKQEQMRREGHDGARLQIAARHSGEGEGARLQEPGGGGGAKLTWSRAGYSCGSGETGERGTCLPGTAWPLSC